MVLRLVFVGMSLVVCLLVGPTRTERKLSVFKNGGLPLRAESIFHAFNWPIRSVKGKLGELADCGYDAIQLSPLQKSIEGDWWARYQPVSHLHIEGLGSESDLRELCSAASKANIFIIADVVFNHMAVIAHRAEWVQACHNPEYKQELYRRLDTRFKPLDRNDFNTWKDMVGDDWDNDSRFDGWGAGEWSDLKPTEKVLGIHKKHLDVLLKCGVKGFRFDAAKHIRPETLRIYSDYIKSADPEAFIYFEILSVDKAMHALTKDMALTTDFPLCYGLHDVVIKGWSADKLKALPQVALDSIRFVRNHDLIKNEEFARGMGYKHGGPRLSIAWVLLCSLDGGSVLVYPDDHDNKIGKASPVKAAVRFRKEMAKRGARGHHVMVFDENEKSHATSFGVPIRRTLSQDILEMQDLLVQAKRDNVRQILIFNLQKLQDQKKESRAKGAASEGRLVAVARGSEGFILVNLSETWAKIPRLTFTGSELQGRYREQCYGFDLVIDPLQHIQEWAGKPSGGVDVGPHSALIFVKSGNS